MENFVIDKRNFLLKKSLARLIACQALCMYYDKNNDDKNLYSILESVNKYYIKNYFTHNDDNKYKNLYKSKFVYEIVNGTINNAEKFDKIINIFLKKQDTTETLDDIILQNFRLACFEFQNFRDIDKNIIVNEYVDIIAEFYDNIYVKFANGILENISIYIRTGNIPQINIEENTKKKIHNSNKKNRKIIKLKQ